MAEAAPYLWFHRDQYQFFGLDANSAVRRVSLRGGRAAFEKNIYAFKFAHSANTAMTKLATGNKLVAARFFLFKERRTIPPIEIVVGTVRGTNHPDVAWQRFASFVQGNFILEQPNLLIL